MRLVQFLLPLNDAAGRPFPREAWSAVRGELVKRCGGATIYSQAPADGLWRERGGEVERDRLIVVEAQDAHFDASWWRHYKFVLRERFAQDEILMRVFDVEAL